VSLRNSGPNLHSRRGETLPLFDRQRPNMLPAPLPVKPDVCENFHEGADTSVAAFEKNKPQLGSLRALVLAHIAECGEFGATLDEATLALGRVWNTVGPRFSELVRDGLVVRLTLKRDTMRGNASHVHVTREVWQEMGRPPLVERRGSRRSA
jgi:hypothetical protein